MRDYSFLSDMINAINMPKEIISVKTSFISISITSFPGKDPEGGVPNPSCETSLLFFSVYHIRTCVPIYILKSSLK